MTLDEKTKARTKSISKYTDTNSHGTEWDQAYNRGFLDGAIPWAEWCQKFEKALEECEDTYLGYIGNKYEKLLKEYRAWLEDK